ncbi:hypothetical protein N7527_009085 [Penicillium freii]|nr:hypothetical protein N7527_009085 [Penicillium freii]
MTTLLTPRETHSPFSDPTGPTAQRYFLEDHVIPKKPMQDDYRARDSSPVASNLPSALPPNFTLNPDQLAYAPTLNNLASENELILPCYDPESLHNAKEPEDVSDASTESHPHSWTLQPPSADDTLIEDEPSRHVDYLSHDWKEEDIWSSWREIGECLLENMGQGQAQPEDDIARKPQLAEGLRCHLALRPTKKFRRTCNLSIPPPSRLETPNSYLDRKPILKKKTASEAILQRSLSQHTLLQHAGAILKAQEAENNWARPPFPRSNTDLDQLHHRTGSSTYSLGGTLTTSSSGMTSPSERRHIHFNNEVVQCIAVEAKSYEDDWPATFEESSSDDGVVLMRQISSRSILSNRSTPRNSFTGDGKTIAPLPSTTLKYRGDSYESHAQTILDRWSTPTPTRAVSPTPSVETLRPSGPSEPSANFLLDECEDPSLDFTGNYPDRDRAWFMEDDPSSDRPIRLTASGMIMPEGETETPSSSILDRVVDTVNTARDIAHVIWNVGWRH